MGRGGEGGGGRWGDGEMGRWGDGEVGRWGDGEIAGIEFSKMGARCSHYFLNN
ncbi:MAG: hypothetical protein F6K24_34470 [Okeania sp. SIO2D1]|nr:hypothetical protein [Okeania sp. SIO2D1]